MNGLTGWDCGPGFSFMLQFGPASHASPPLHLAASSLSRGELHTRNVPSFMTDHCATLSVTHHLKGFTSQAEKITISTVDTPGPQSTPLLTPADHQQGDVAECWTRVPDLISRTIVSAPGCCSGCWDQICCCADHLWSHSQYLHCHSAQQLILDLQSIYHCCDNPIYIYPTI